MNLELEAFEGELTQLRKLRKQVIAYQVAGKRDIFICGRSDATNAEGLPEKIMVCPMLGSDVLGSYVLQQN